MSKHTPGPWHVADGEPFVVVTGGGGVDYRPEPLVSNDDPEELEANARLIAAAPELLEIVREVFGKDHTGGSMAREAHVAIPMRDCWRDVSRRLDAAIRKAEVVLAKVEQPPAAPVHPSRPEDLKRGTK